MSNLDEKDKLPCPDDGCNGIESCDCQGICTCEPEDIDFDEALDDCDDCCCGDDDDCDDEDDFEEEA